MIGAINSHSLPNFKCVSHSLSNFKCVELAEGGGATLSQFDTLK